ncbi:MAG: aminotransferase class V-fold PLP-dependent enzyme, partial [Planctomycetales bacterium]
MPEEATPAPLDLDAVRRDFPILKTLLHGGSVPLVYLDNAASTQVPRQVLDAMVSVYETCYSNVHRGVHQLSEQSTNAYEQAREKVRAFINAKHVEEIIFTRGTTEGINLVANAWGTEFLNEGDEILLTVMEHHSNLVPWQQAAQRTGAVLRHIPITDDGLLELDRLDELLTER